MPDQILLYFSAAPDLEREREVLGRAVAEIPVTLGWQILQTPSRGEPADLEAARRADVHLLLHLSGHILERAVPYTLKPEEFEQLKTWKKGLEAETGERLDDQRGATGESGVILSPERYFLSEGVLIQPKKD